MRDETVFQEPGSLPSAFEIAYLDSDDRSNRPAKYFNRTLFGVARCIIGTNSGQSQLVYSDIVRNPLGWDIRIARLSCKVLPPPCQRRLLFIR